MDRRHHNDRAKGTQGNPLSQATTNSTGTNLKLNACFLGDRTATNRLSGFRYLTVRSRYDSVPVAKLLVMTRFVSDATDTNDMSLLWILP